jgi:hypothetical protein
MSCRKDAQKAQKRGLKLHLTGGNGENLYTKQTKGTKGVQKIFTVGLRCAH